ncbi:cell division protein SepF [Philodulcilactobacillus myokoensis]|uniref:Cell division protein SepF n=1 Tax=Philodulcilactobacillus myokoensis TaxID=2929573 RepID=A0A9W6ETH4_9LACO|nr:cell division protein SepF [Philodulcilactobacillus myokoensis]GLB47019.1 cell division protein SepF [Philodulcilactobacillus myokoensis]
MSDRFNLSNFFGINEPEDSDKENAAINNSSKVVPMKNGNRIVKNHIAIFEPRIYSDSKGIASKLVNNNAVIVNFNKADNNSIRRIIDFLNGSIFTIDGHIERISSKVFLFTPHNYEISNSIKDRFK